MQSLQDKKQIYSPLDLVTFLSCNYSTILNQKRITENLLPAEEGASTKLFAKKGLEHEISYLNNLKDQGKKIIEIPKNLSLKERIAQTNDALKSGPEVIYQAVLYNNPWRGDADFLIKCDTASQLGDFSYEVLDTKLSRTAEAKHLIQLCGYAELLDSLQGVMPSKVHLFLGDKKRYSFNLTDFIFYYSYAKKRFLNFTGNLPKDLSANPCNHCNVCEWKEYCFAKWKKDDHLSLVANMQNSQRKKLNKFGVNSVKDLASTDEGTIVPNFNREVFARLRDQAVLQKHKEETGEDKYQILAQLPRKGLERMPRTNDGDLFFDMEGDPLYPDGLEYLFGIYYLKGDKKIFKTFWAHNHKEEKQAFCEFMEFLKEHFKKYPKAYVYHYNHYETTALKRLACRYGSCEEQLDNLLRRQKFIDLYFVVRESIRISEPGYSIKNLETFYMDKRSEIVTTAADSIVVYNEWRVTNNTKLLQEISDYNKVDCISTYLLRNWLISLKPKEAPWFEPEVSTDSVEVKKDWEIEYESYKAQLENSDNNEVKTHLSNLLEFHNREAKPKWWSMFERQSKYEDEIIEDTECIGAMELIGNPEAEKRSLIYSYKFPEQETKLKKGSQVFNTSSMEQVGTITNIDARYVKIKRSASRDKLPEKLSIGPSGPIDSKLIRSAIYRYAETVIQESNTKNCINDLLRRSIPRISNKTPGEKIITSNNLQKDAFDAIANLDNSYLFIQGPPGAGKTYISSHIIVDLMKRGKKIGITSNSHKAIHNLLKRIEEVSKEKDFSFQGIKKATASNVGTFFEGNCIANEIKTDKISFEANLFAGTAWLFSHEHFERKLDYLFIDEAGQVALANVVAMSISTKNLILVGDQMQLGQPVQGTHPEDAGLSVLEFLLGNNATIPAEQGVFLSETRRLEPNICDFISNAFYDGRLTSHESTKNRKLSLKDCDLPNEGISFIAAGHEACSQKSVEEGDIIKKKFQELLGQEFYDNGTKRIITKKDILIVTPYNVQVNYLSSILPEDARVGTVDNFQGQEAPIVLISMVTSSAEYLPRNIEFLYSRNRLNVAISRAECLAVIIANPKLLEVPCKTIDQMKMVNSFCHAHSQS